MSAEPSAPGGSGLVRVCRLAEGGMARVDLAIKRAGTFRRMYAVKRLHPHLASDPEFRQMFIEEARIAGMIRHPNVVGVLDVGEDELGPFLVMDYVDGLPLFNLLNRARQSGEQMPVQIAVRIALDIAQGLHAAHELKIDARTIGVVHRDLSPQNVMVGFDGQARLTDFGIAKALGYGTKTATGVVKGKTSYLSPEQIRSEEPDRRTDLFSLGIVLFEMLSGERLYKRGDGPSDMHAIIEDPVPDIGELRSDVPDELVRLLFELLAKRRDARPPDADQVVRRLESILAELINHEEPTPVAEYVELLAGDAKREQARVIADAIAEVEQGIRSPPAPAEVAAPAADTILSPTPPRGSPRSTPSGVWLGLLVLVLTIGVVARLTTRAQPQPPRPPVEQTPPVVAPPPTEEPEPIPASPVVETLPAPPSKPREVARRRGKVRRAVQKPNKAEPKPLPDWVEFER